MLGFFAKKIVWTHLQVCLPEMLWYTVKRHIHPLRSVPAFLCKIRLCFVLCLGVLCITEVLWLKQSGGEVQAVKDPQLTPYPWRLHINGSISGLSYNMFWHPEVWREGWDNFAFSKSCRYCNICPEMEIIVHGQEFPNGRDTPISDHISILSYFQEK